MNITTRYFNSAYIVLFTIIIWEPLKYYIEPISRYSYVYYAIIVLGIINEVVNKKFLKRFMEKPYFIWAVWILYSLLNTVIMKYNITLNIYTYIFTVILPIFIMLILGSNKYPLNNIINVIIFSFSLRVLLSLIFDSFFYSNLDNVVRLGEDYNSNSIAFGAFFLFVSIGIKYFYNGKLSIINYVQYIVAIITIILTSSRKSFFAVFIMIVGLIYSNRSQNKINRYLKYIFAVILLFGVMYILLFNTNLGSRLTGVYNRTISASNPDEMFDTRARQYILGAEIFKSNFINGIGLYNFTLFSVNKKTAHSELIVQFVECGLIGALIWVLFYLWIILKIKYLKKYDKMYRMFEYLTFFLLSVFVLMLGAWVYNLSIYWVIIGLLIRIIKDREHAMKMVMTP